MGKFRKMDVVDLPYFCTGVTDTLSEHSVPSPESVSLLLPVPFKTTLTSPHRSQEKPAKDVRGVFLSLYRLRALPLIFVSLGKSDLLLGSNVYLSEHESVVRRSVQHR